MPARKRKATAEIEETETAAPAKKQPASDRLDETVPGGRYIGTDGKAHDADGKPIK